LCVRLVALLEYIEQARRPSMREIRRALLRELMAVRTAAGGDARGLNASHAMLGTGSTWSRSLDKKLRHLSGLGATTAVVATAVPHGGRGGRGGRGSGKGGRGGGGGAAASTPEGAPAGGMPITGAVVLSQVGALPGSN
jgi:hypothetical protein